MVVDAVVSQGVKEQQSHGLGQEYRAPPPRQGGDEEGPQFLGSHLHFLSPNCLQQHTPGLKAPGPRKRFVTGLKPGASTRRSTPARATTAACRGPRLPL